MTTTTFDQPTAVREADLPPIDLGVRTGYTQKYQGFFEPERGIRVRAGSLYAEPPFHSPRHRHTFQQVRFIVSGAIRYGSQVYEAGDCLYIPEGAYYGPIRPATDSSKEIPVHYVDMQFMGPSEIPYPHPDEVVRAQNALASRGRFDEGIYIDADNKKHDAYEAILQEITGQQISYPEPRLMDPVLMRTGLYPWVPLRESSGVGVRHLGYFFETGPNLKMVSLAGHSRLPGGRSTSQQVRFLLKGRISFAGDEYGPISIFFYPPSAEYPEVEAQEAAEMLVVQWTTGDAAAPEFCQI